LGNSYFIRTPTADNGYAGPPPGKLTAAIVGQCYKRTQHPRQADQI
jgi:hypothetical protein